MNEISTLCKICGKIKQIEESILCNNCWELNTRIDLLIIQNPEKATKWLIKQLEKSTSKLE